MRVKDATKNAKETIQMLLDIFWFASSSIHPSTCIGYPPAISEIVDTLSIIIYFFSIFPNKQIPDNLQMNLISVPQLAPTEMTLY